MDIQKNIDRFEAEMAKVDRKGLSDLMDYIRNKSDMYSAPASTRFHLSVPGGLLQHSLNVLDALRSLLVENDDKTYSFLICGKKVDDPKFSVTEESIIVIALLHDICKTRFYKQEEKWKKDENGKWISYLTYVCDDTSPLGHGEKSCMMIQQYMKLEPVELYAIRWHMGFTDDSKNTSLISSAIDKYPILWAVHNADMIASHFMEDTLQNISLFNE